MNSYCTLLKITPEFYKTYFKKNKKVKVSDFLGKHVEQMGGKIVHSAMMIGGEYNILMIIDTPDISNLVAGMAKIFSTNAIEHYKVYTLVNSEQEEKILKLI